MGKRSENRIMALMENMGGNSSLEPIDLDSEFLNTLGFVIKMLSRKSKDLSKGECHGPWGKDSFMC